VLGYPISRPPAIGSKGTELIKLVTPEGGDILVVMAGPKSVMHAFQCQGDVSWSVVADVRLPWMAKAKVSRCCSRVG
jgi:hypothetical protein